MLNILNNAYYALTDKKKKSDSSYIPTLSIHTGMHNDSFEIRVRDNGTGVSEETGKKIFTPSFTTKPSSEGTGLGLSLSRNIVEKEHNGSLTFRSQEGLYTEFIIKLPKS
ncbi:MAG: GHKL domain-containing protein [Parachlamydiaceae bacterium]|nr:GHKL domain-containing protein [Parachlamydiaceae bacterium]